MNQFALFHFTITKNDRLFQVLIQPGTPWEDLESVLDEFKEKFSEIKKDQLEKAEAEKAGSSEEVKAELA